MAKLSMEYSKPLKPILVPIPKSKSKLKCVSYIKYLIGVKQQLVEALINSDSEVNVINQDFTKKLVLEIYKTKVDAQKIDSLKLDTFGMVITSFSIEDKERRSRFFDKQFLLADINMDITLGILFLTFSNIEMDFMDQNFY